MKRVPANFRRLDQRLINVYEAIRTGAHPNANQLARALGVAPRTVKRDIEYLRDSRGVGIGYDAVKHGYYLTDPEGTFPGGPFSEAEILSLFVARQALSAHQGTAMERILSEGFRRLESRLDGHQRYWLGDVASLISFRAPAPEELQAEIFQKLLVALRERRELRFQYHGLKDPGPLPRQVRGYHLGCVDQKWYLFGWDTDREAQRIYALSRMSEVEVTARRFRPPDSFDLAKTLAGAFGVHTGEPGREIVVEIRFDAWAARLIRERHWHPTQELRADGDGLILILRLGGLDEIHRWVLSWGEHAEVLAPEELRHRVHQTARAILARSRTGT